MILTVEDIKQGKTDIGLFKMIKLSTGEMRFIQHAHKHREAVKQGEKAVSAAICQYEDKHVKKPFIRILESYSSTLEVSMHEEDYETMSKMFGVQILGRWEDESDLR